MTGPRRGLELRVGFRRGNMELEGTYRRGEGGGVRWSRLVGILGAGWVLRMLGFFPDGLAVRALRW